MRTTALMNFIRERHSAYENKRHGLPKPWSKDRIIQRYRFCNVYRELDTQTQWFALNWRNPNSQNSELWFASLVFRFINWSETATDIGFPVPWEPDRFKSAIKIRKESGKKVYSGAYMISTHGVQEEKRIYLAKSLSKIWDNRVHVRPRRGELLEEFHERLMGCFDVGSFLAAQVVADIKYAEGSNLFFAKDWFSFAASGPGSRRGMSRVMNLDIKHKWEENAWRLQMKELQAKMLPLVEKSGMANIHAQDLQNCLCEFDKYERVRLGQGFPKQRYNGVK